MYEDPYLYGQSEYGYNLGFCILFSTGGLMLFLTAINTKQYTFAAIALMVTVIFGLYGLFLFISMIKQKNKKSDK